MQNFNVALLSTRSKINFGKFVRVPKCNKPKPKMVVVKSFPSTASLSIILGLFQQIYEKSPSVGGNQTHNLSSIRLIPLPLDQAGEHSP